MSLEHEQFLVSIEKNPEELRRINHLQGLYEAALTEAKSDRDVVVLYQLLAFTHYHFLVSFAALMRGHLSEAFASARVAIDAALIGAQIIHDRPSQRAYARREPPFDNYARYLGNLIKDGRPLPHPLVRVLFKLHKKVSTFAAHADVGSFIHRMTVADDRRSAVFEYFQFSRNEPERQSHGLTLCHTFVMTLDVFSDFLVMERKQVPAAWQQELRGLGAAVEQRHTALKATLRD